MNLRTVAGPNPVLRDGHRARPSSNPLMRWAYSDAVELKAEEWDMLWHE
jgi:hypothetical protein